MSAAKRGVFCAKLFGRRCLSLRQKKSKNFFALQKKYFSQREAEERESTDRIATARIVTLKFFIPFFATQIIINSINQTNRFGGQLLIFGA